eukprot:TRINITY_DN1539_c0_g3_i2.p1 TRINITY_DN1539_c0_g3~~TRINITY_DN1539_c0_g3_i2.p1  ORF type:complete len:827 (-),score=265.12 TRINITY_DN1539_c0_g3_i2:50-2530(-)
MKVYHTTTSFKVLIVALFLIGFFVFPTITYASAEEVSASGDTINLDLKGAKVPLKTDDEVVQREEQAINSEGYSVAELKQIREAAETHTFQAEVNRLMHIIINSLYSNRDIFLRELISNASDALDKIRFLSLTNPGLLGEGEQANLEVRIKADKANNQLHIIDRGIGMTKDEMIKNLGTIAQSGTREFLTKMAEGGDKSSNLIGQFGVGFYSIFLVADKVTVTSKHNDDDQYVWESTADSSFSISKDPRGNTLGRGTRITLHLKEDAKEYLNQDTIKSLAKKYSEFINFPIYLQTETTVEEEVPIEEEEKEETEVKTEEEGVSVDEEGEEEEVEEAPKTKKVSHTEYNWELLNEIKPIWTRSPDKITEEEYNNFYRAISKDSEDPLAYTHFSAEGEAEFKSILFFPKVAPSNVFDPNPAAHKGNLKLFVKRVFITDDFHDLIPSYLRFIRGIIDSDDLPLNVSREQLQKHKLLQTIQKKIVRKAIAMMQTLADKARKKAEEDKEEDEEPTVEKTEEEEEDTQTAKEKWETFWTQFGANVKLGVLEDGSNRSRLVKLLMFHSTKTGELTSFEEYVSRMKEDQEEIYYLAGASKEALQKSPLLERLLKRGYEVLLMTEPIDEYCLGNVPKFDGKKIINLGKDPVKAIEDEIDKETEKETETKFQPLVDFLKTQFSDKLEKVVVSHRLTQSPVALLASQGGYTANMERVIKAQALGPGGSSRIPSYIPKKILEINPYHPILVELLRRVTNDASDETAKITAKVLYETAVLSSGFVVEDSTDFASWIHKMMSVNLDLDPNTVVEEPEYKPKKPVEPAEESHDHDHEHDEL